MITQSILKIIRKKQIILFFYFSFQMITEKEIVLRVFYQLCSFGCQPSFYLFYFVCWIHIEKKIILLAGERAYDQGIRREKKIVWKIFICIMRDTFWKFSIGLSSEIVNAIIIVIAFFYSSFVWAIFIRHYSNHWFWCQFVLVVIWCFYCLFIYFFLLCLTETQRVVCACKRDCKQIFKSTFAICVIRLV